MSYPVFYVPAGDVLPVYFDSYAGSTGASVTISGLAVTDIEIYKDGSVTQRASDAGYTLLDTDGIDFDGLTGIHGFSIDTGDNTDAGFYTVGAWFTVVVSAITVDSQTVSFVACQFRLMPAESVAGKPKVDVDTFGGNAATTSGGRPEVNTTHIAGSSVSTTTAQIGVNVVQISTDATAADNLEAALDGTGSVTITAAITGNITGNLSGSVGSVTGAVGSVTGNVGGNVTGTIGGLTAAALKDFFDTDSTTTYASAVAGSVVKEIADNAGGSALTAAAIADAVWDEAQADHVGAGTFGILATEIADILVDTAVIGAAGAGLSAIPWNASWDAEVESEVNDALIAQNLDHLVKSAVDTDFATTVHLNSVIGMLADDGTTATFDRTTDSQEAIRNRGDSAWTTAIGFSTHSATDVWSAATRTLTAIDEDTTTLDLDATIRAAVGLAAADLDTQLATIDNFLDTEVAAIKAKTDQLTFTTANQVDATTITISTGAVSAAALATDAVNEIADGLLDRNMATGADNGTEAIRTVRQALRSLRNKVSISAGTATITKEDDSTTSWTAAVTTSAGDPISAVDPTNA